MTHLGRPAQRGPNTRMGSGESMQSQMQQQQDSIPKTREQKIEEVWKKAEERTARLKEISELKFIAETKPFTGASIHINVNYEKYKSYLAHVARNTAAAANAATNAEQQQQGDADSDNTVTGNADSGGQLQQQQQQPKQQQIQQTQKPQQQHRTHNLKVEFVNMHSSDLFNGKRQTVTYTAGAHEYKAWKRTDGTFVQTNTSHPAHT